MRNKQRDPRALPASNSRSAERNAEPSSVTRSSMQSLHRPSASGLRDRGTNPQALRQG
jgi:hypothetical protein